MFSSLASASKIYVSSSKPRQKSATSSRRRKKRPHNSSSDIGLADATLVSLIDQDRNSADFGGLEDFSSPRNILDRTVRAVLSEDSEIVDETLYEEDFPNESSVRDVVDFDDVGRETKDVGSSVKINAENNEIQIESDVSDSENQPVLGSPSENPSTVELPAVSLDHTPDFFDLEGCSENVSSDAKNDLLNKVVDLSESGAEDIDNVNNISESTITDNAITKGVSENPSTDCVNAEDSGDHLSLDLTETTISGRTVIPNVSSENLESDNISISNLSKVQDNPLNIDNETVSTKEETVHSTRTSNSSKKPDIPLNVDLEIVSTKEEAVTTTQILYTSKENTTSSDQGHETILSKEGAIHPTRTSNPSKENNFNSNVNYEIAPTEEGVDHSTRISISPEEQKILSNVDHRANVSIDDFQERARSPEHSELSCTESVSNDNLRQKSDTSQSYSDEEARDNLQKLDFSRSYSDLGSVQTPDLKRCSSLPHTLKETERIDRGTATSHFPCESCGSVEGIGERKVDFDRRLFVSRGVSAKLEDSTPRDGLPPLTTAHARARSYVFGSTGHTGSLLGSDELSRFFPGGQVTIFVGTWNMNSHSPPKNIDDFLLPLDIDVLPDIYAIGVQEGMQSRFEWEVQLQSTLGPSHVLFASSSLGVLHLSIFMRRDLVWFCSEPEDASVATRPGTMVKTKGAVAVSFTFFGTSFLFLNSHLAAHEQKLKERLLDYEKICSNLDLPKSTYLKSKDKDVTSRFDVSLWCGDLNFRVEHDRPSVLSFVEQRLCTKRPSCSFLVKRDQLTKAMREGTAFAGFQEGVIHFNPSYKFEVGTNQFATTRLRVPSYTDRILYRYKEGRSSVSCVHYDAAPNVSTSDHKPVFGVYTATLRPGRDNVPLAAGMFKRDIYLEALKRRSQFVGALPQGQSAVCTLM